MAHTNIQNTCREPSAWNNTLAHDNVYYTYTSLYVRFFIFSITISKKHSAYAHIHNIIEYIIYCATVEKKNIGNPRRAIVIRFIYIYCFSESTDAGVLDSRCGFAEYIYIPPCRGLRLLLSRVFRWNLV